MDLQGPRQQIADRAFVGISALVAATTLVLGLLLSGAPPARSAGQDPVIAAAGDIACDPQARGFANGQGVSDECRQLGTSNLLRPALAAVLPLGDNQYTDGRLWKYRHSFHLSWGRFRAIERPVPGNHEYAIPKASGYFKYFNGAQKTGRAGTRGDGYYSYDIGSWHLIALNSNCGKVSCAHRSRQLDWLRQDLLAHATSQCVLAYWHHPWFLSGHPEGFKPRTRPFWATLYTAGADVVLNGHLHAYERFGPQDPDGHGNHANGIREFIVGTGGRSHERFGPPAANSRVRIADEFGVLKLTLLPGRYRWRFVTEDHRVLDRGFDSCH